AVDESKPDRCKIGYSSRAAKLRIAEASNPDYCLFTEILTRKAKAVEKAVHEVIEIAGVRRIEHKCGGRSEWFELSPQKAVIVVRCIVHAAEHTSLHPLVREVCVSLVAG